MYIISNYGSMRYFQDVDIIARLIATGDWKVLSGFDTNDENAPYALVYRKKEFGKLLIIAYCKTLLDAEKCQARTSKAFQIVETATLPKG